MNEDEKNRLYAHPGWEACTFEGSRRKVLELGLRTSFREKLEWLDATEEMLLRARAAREEKSRALETGGKPGSNSVS